MPNEEKRNKTDCLGRLLPNWGEIELFSLPLPMKIKIGDNLPEGIISHLGLRPPAHGSFFKIKPIKNFKVIHDNIRDEYEKIAHLLDAGLELEPGKPIPSFAKHSDFDGIWMSGPRTLIIVRPDKIKISSYGVK